MNKLKFVYVTHIATTPEKLWAALTSAEFTLQYWGRDWPRPGVTRRIQSDWKVGSPVKMVLEDGEPEWQGEVLQYDPPQLLSYTFNVQTDEEERSRVTFELEPMGSVVKLTVTHDNFEPDSKAKAFLEGISRGWPAILSSLKSLLETDRSSGLTWKE